MGEKMASSSLFLYAEGAGPNGESRALTLNSGKKNRGGWAGLPYRGISWAGIVEAAAAPRSYPKSKAPFIIPSTYREHDGRTHAVQKEMGSFGLLTLDFDSHTPIEALEAALKKVLGDVEWLAYSTSSATLEEQKLRGLIPLAEMLPGGDFTATQEAFFELLEAEGLKPDAKLRLTGQPVILPNRGDWYHHHHNKGPRLELHPEHPIVLRRAQRAAEAAEAAAEAQRKAEEAEASAQRRTARKASQPRSAGGSALYAADFASLVDSFNAEHNLASELLRYGWTPQPGNAIDFRSPFQTSGSFATRVYPEGYALSLSGSDAEQGFGRETPNGALHFDAFELFAHFEHRGDRGAAVRDWQSTLHKRLPTFEWADTPRDDKGRWTGHTAIVTDKPAPAPDFVTVAEAGERIRAAVKRFVEEKPAVMAIAASPGAGKSRHAREILAKALPELRGDIAFYTPTLELAEEAAAHFRELGVQAVAVRGRLALDVGREERLTEGDEGLMCLRPELVRSARAVGLAEGRNVCKRGRGLLEERCPHWDKCPWVQQWAVPEDKPVVRCMAHNYLHLPDGSGRSAPALHVVDEACWQGVIGKGEVPIADWLQIRSPQGLGTWDILSEDEATAQAADMLQAARDVLAVLQDKLSLKSPALSWTPEDFREFANAEVTKPMLGLGPKASDNELREKIAGLKTVDKHAGKRAAIWRVLADALEGGKDVSERVLVRGDVLEVHWRREMPTGPTLHLDADADRVILGALYPQPLGVRPLHPSKAERLLWGAEQRIKDARNARRRREALVEGWVPTGAIGSFKKAWRAVKVYQNLCRKVLRRQRNGESRCQVVGERENRIAQRARDARQFRYQARLAQRVREDMANRLEAKGERAKATKAMLKKRLRAWHLANPEIVKAELRPRAEIVQVTDKTFSKRALLGTEAKPAGAGLRREVVQLVRAEVMRDRAQLGGGVLVVASKAVVERIFEDAGRKASLGAELHGAVWIWYGPASKGLNDWRHFGTVLELGREELPPSAIEAQARGLWGDGAEPLVLPEADDKGNVIVPEAVLPVLMADGSAMALHGRAYADSRLRALQVQSRENAGRQAAERLRMAHGVTPKRWVRLNNVPLSTAPVGKLVRWAELRPSRLTAAVAEAVLGKGFLRLSPKGLAADAPEVFPTEKGAERWREKELTPSPLVETLLGVGGLIIEMRLQGQRGRHPTSVIIPAVTCPEAAKALLEQELGPLAYFEVLETSPTPADSAVSEIDNRLKYMSESLGYRPQFTVREVETSIFVAGQPPVSVMVEALRRRGWQVSLE